MFSFQSVTSSLAGTDGLKRHLVDLKFGTNGHNCRGFGICLIYDPAGPDPVLFSQILLEGDVLTLEIPFSKTKENPELFEGDYFRMEEAYELPADICKKLGLDYSPSLPQGEHKMYQTFEGITIQFKLKE